jgi:hypothetical protein
MSIRGLFGGYLWGRAGLFNLFAAFLTLGEPASTRLLRMVQDLRLNKHIPVGAGSLKA